MKYIKMWQTKFLHCASLILFVFNLSSTSSEYIWGMELIICVPAMVWAPKNYRNYFFSLWLFNSQIKQEKIKVHHTFKCQMTAHIWNSPSNSRVCRGGIYGFMSLNPSLNSHSFLLHVSVACFLTWHPSQWWYFYWIRNSTKICSALV